MVYIEVIIVIFILQIKGRLLRQSFNLEPFFNFPNFGLEADVCSHLNSAHRCQIGLKFGIIEFLVKIYKYAIIIGEVRSKKCVFFIDSPWNDF